MAELVSIKRNVDVSPGQAAPAVFHCSQGDVGSKIILGLLNNGTAYAIPSGVTVTIEGSESNGSIFTPISATASGSDITFYLTGEMTAVAGPAICQAVLKSGSNILGTANFTLEVESSPMGADAPPVFTDAGWTWMLNKLTTEFVPALGNETIIDAIDSKLDKNQGTANAGKYLKVGTDGNVTTVATDTTLSASDGVADAKAVGDAINVVGSSLSDVVTQLRDDIYDKRIVKNQYINNNGNIIDYNGWDRTDYINIEGVYLLKVTAVEASNCNCFYNINKELVYALSANGQTISDTINLAVGENVVVVPPDAKYVIFSGTANAISHLIIEPLKMRADAQINKHTHYIQTDLNGRQVVVFDVDDFEVGKRLNASGNEVSDTRAAITTDYYPIYNTQNKYSFECQGYRVVICQYVKNSDGTYTFVRASDNYIQNSGKLWCSTGVTHVRIYFQKNNSAILSSAFVEDFCNLFVMRETGDINKYLRVCTFNQAANYPHFMNATEEDLNKRIVNYLNFIGEYNPDVLCAQEAVATYFQPVSYEKSTAAVFDRKYLYRYQSGYQRQTWSKYNYAHAEKIDFTTQAEGDSRFYGKQTIYFEGKEIVILNTHCAYQGESDFETVRKKQFEQLRDEMAQHEYCILCGDFNAWSADEFGVFVDYNKANCGEYGVIDTWYVGTEYADWPFKAIDNIITTPNIVIQNVVRGPYDFDYFSDHAPLIADLQIR